MCVWCVYMQRGFLLGSRKSVSPFFFPSPLIPSYPARVLPYLGINTSASHSLDLSILLASMLCCYTFTLIAWPPWQT